MTPADKLAAFFALLEKRQREHEAEQAKERKEREDADEARITPPMAAEDRGDEDHLCRTVDNEVGRLAERCFLQHRIRPVVELSGKHIVVAIGFMLGEEHQVSRELCGHAEQNSAHDL